MGGSTREGSRCCTRWTPYGPPRLAAVFNMSGSEIIVLLLLALIVLGPERLPDAVRSFGRVYGQVRRMGDGFRTEMRSALEEPVRELRETADLARRAVMEAPEPDDEPDDEPEPGPVTGADPVGEVPPPAPSEPPPSRES